MTSIAHLNMIGKKRIAYIDIERFDYTNILVNKVKVLQRFKAKVVISLIVMAEEDALFRDPVQISPVGRVILHKNGSAEVLNFEGLLRIKSSSRIQLRKFFVNYKFIMIYIIRIVHLYK